MCQLCESRDADILCESCKRLFIYCKDCYYFSHKSDSLSAHKKRTITNENRQSLVSEGYLCKDHPDERYTFICKTCDVPVCNECIIGGQHKSHKAMPPNEYISKLIEAKTKRLESGDLPYEDIAKCIASIEEGYGRRKSLVHEMVETIDKLFSGVLRTLGHARAEAVQKFDDLESLCLARKQDLIARASKMLSRQDKTIHDGNVLKDELEILVKRWRKDYDETQGIITRLENMLYTSTVKDVVGCNQPVDFANFKVRLAEIATKCAKLKKAIHRKCSRRCLLSQVCEHSLLVRPTDPGTWEGAAETTWNTASSVAFSNCMDWHCFLVPRRLPDCFCARIKLSSIASAVGDWTHALGITDDYSLKQKIRPGDYAILFNTGHWAFTPNFESSARAFRDNDIITITVNSKMEMRVQVNDEPEVISHRNINKGTFYLFCSLYGRKQELEILSLKEIL